MLRLKLPIGSAPTQNWAALERHTLLTMMQPQPTEGGTGNQPKAHPSERETDELT